MRDYSLEQLSEVAPYRFKSDDELCSNILKLIDVFNHQREKISSIYDKDEYLSAYLFYFFATNVHKISAAFKFLKPEHIQRLSQSDFIDFGSGPATASLGLLQCLPEFKKSFFLVEQSMAMNNLAQKMMTHFAPSSQANFSTNISGVPTSATLCFSHSFNEISRTDFQQIVTKSNPSQIILLEPGTKAVFAKTLELRQWLFDQGYSFAYPCSAELPCPLEGVDDWCHQYLKLKFPESVERITQKLKKDRRNSPVTFQVYFKGRVVERTQKIVYRGYKELKYGYSYNTCENCELKKNEITRKKMKIAGVKKREVKALLCAGNPHLPDYFDN